MLSIDRAVAFLPELYVFRVGQFFSVSVEWLAVKTAFRNSVRVRVSQYKTVRTIEMKLKRFSCFSQSQSLSAVCASNQRLGAER